ncbi:hypothetical protein TSOC_013173 [Tetrabaena socialis]|uniref:Uncharacterized protein n=1 Tax=Tetrabaena socialis TaxID=47790 RepID=A0A2J7ZL17_9CHLO|nr:hypothetical protein TSOC_013173 [Tetrabaena socialis]|eukprot:PNH00967.1 hypothetical protein TSOC_013173 [Tetrabaena socialis]
MGAADSSCAAAACAHDPFTGNVATLLLQWPPARTHGKERSWRSVVEDARFLQLFPRRYSPVTSHVLNNLQTMMESDDDEEPGGSGDDLGAPRFQAHGSAASRDPQHAAAMELMAQFKRHLRDNMPANGGASFAVGSFAHDNHDSDSDAEGDRGRGAEPAAEWSAGTRRARALSQRHTRSEQGHTTGTKGRRNRAPSQPQRGRVADAPWDDTKPFQTPYGTVYGYWRLCPYG